MTDTTTAAAAGAGKGTAKDPVTGAAAVASADEGVTEDFVTAASAACEAAACETTRKNTNAATCSPAAEASKPQKPDAQERFLRWLYTSAPGRALLPLITRPFITKLGGAVMNSALSKRAIPGFIRNNNIDMSDFEERPYRSYNDFFTRKILPGKRPICADENTLISPCDALLSAYAIEHNARFQIKGSRYTLPELLRNAALSKRYTGGTLLLFRLTVRDYHRYCYAASGAKSADVLIPGVFHTVNPLAAATRPLYKENTRIYGLVETEKFGTLLQMEVGALMVGKIVNDYPEACTIERGCEKGHFEFGGSTIIVLLEPGVAQINETYFQNTAQGQETPVRYGQAVGVSLGVKK